MRRLNLPALLATAWISVLGASPDEARAMVRRLAGRAHEVFTGIAVRRGAREASAVERVRVTFRVLTDAEVAAYVATGEPMDKAGAYGIQGYGATLVERIDGDYFAVMGLSLVRTVALLREVGVDYPFGPVVDILLTATCIGAKSSKVRIEREIILYFCEKT